MKWLYSLFILLTFSFIHSNTFLKAPIVVNENPQIVANKPSQFDTRQTINYRLNTEYNKQLTIGSSEIKLFERPIEVGIGQYVASNPQLPTTGADLRSRNMHLAYVGRK